MIATVLDIADAEVQAEVVLLLLGDSGGTALVEVLVVRHRGRTDEVAVKKDEAAPRLRHLMMMKHAALWQARHPEDDLQTMKDR